MMPVSATKILLMAAFVGVPPVMIELAFPPSVPEGFSHSDILWINGGAGTLQAWTLREGVWTPITHGTTF
jgi:hypothetical protein